ncbi:hypothetical protein CONCODRAFT_11376 [Conidiobolus coronatus NRRL 28638]|uniref:ABC transporter domain-containing protein n=1 Tax=Conidiobolus coronatus (strain ATCC 28846 / CBS 209.66 / NRRL 28638) TaxID=796925 RepID=A0A137NVB7_CONC2|nr:hypothetical protein CONCODRAFT_11376 [Conidiobolus coronatus NRRL 28638]|eukprot:KXN66726.1 hypothetical protein CONCODRAFT_11376 [Conidiobolus coronatus NRRL 28638]
MPSGECILNNASGAGKSTLLGTLIGKLKPSRGYIQLNGDTNFQKHSEKLEMKKYSHNSLLGNGNSSRLAVLSGQTLLTIIKGWSLIRS